MSNATDFNRTLIAAFRTNGGKGIGPFADAPLLLLNTIGAKSGQSRTNPVAYTIDGNDPVIIASNAGLPAHPDWYYNILAHPVVMVELGTERFQAQALIASGAERTRLYAQMVKQIPAFAEYERKTSRQIPVVILKRQESGIVS